MLKKSDLDRDDDDEDSDHDDDSASSLDSVDWELIKGDLQGGLRHVERRCTDVPCIIVWLFMSAGILALASPALFANKQVSHAVNNHFGSRVLCRGSVTFFCRNTSGALTLKISPPDIKNGRRRPERWTSYHTCLKECPNSTAPVPGCGGNVTGTSERGYRSVLDFDLVCKPVDYDDDDGEDDEEYDLAGQFEAWEMANTHILITRIALRHKSPMATTCLVSIALSYVSFWFFYLSVDLVIHIGIFVLSVIPLWLGLWLSGLLYFVPVAHRVMPEPPDEDIYTPLSLLLLLIGMTFTGVMCFMQEQIRRAVECLEGALICVGQVRATIVHPMLVLVMCLLVGVLHAVAYIVKSSIFHGPQSHWIVDAAILISWAFQTQSVIMYSEMVLDYIVAVWCFNGGLRADPDSDPEGYVVPVGRVTREDVLRAYWIPLRYHMGSVFLGAATTGLLRPLRSTFGSFVRFLTMRTNPISGFFSFLCGPCIGIWSRRLEPLSDKGAFIDVATSGRPFCRAARQNAKISDSQDPAVAILSGATRILQALFVGLNVSASWGCVVLQGRAAKWNSSAAVFLGLVSIAFSATLSLPFALLLDTISDTILYCKSVDMEIQRRQKTEQANEDLVPCFRNLHALRSFFGGLSMFDHHGQDRPQESSFAESPASSETRSPLIESGRSGKHRHKAA